MNESDLVRLRHIVDAAHEVIEFTRSESRASLDSDLKLVRALSMSISIIGEAASHLSDELREANLHIPWRQIVGMRNFVIHAYFNLDLDILWNTATESVPSLLPELVKLLPPDQQE
jgi:uncharacterized protein with HEPN domain